MANERVLVDDLPYIDQEYADPSLRDVVWHSENSYLYRRKDGISIYVKFTSCNCL